MRRTSSASSTDSPSTPVVSRQWGSQRNVEVDKQLYPRAQAALSKLRAIPGIEPFEKIASEPTHNLPPHLRYSLNVVPSEYLVDPVSLLRRMFRLGVPLSLVYNAVAEKEQLECKLEILSPEDALDIRKVKRAIYLFCACVPDLGVLNKERDLFTISQIFSDSTGELFYPLRTLDILLSRLDPVEAAASMPLTPVRPSSSSTDNSTVTSTPLASQDQRSKVVDELLQTERKYVQDLETLLVYHDEMVALGIPRETVVKICPGLPKLVEFQRRFLVGCEFQTSEFKPQDQNFGWLFLHMRSGFEIYKTYTLGQKEATQTAIGETAALMPLSHILEPLYELPATLLKPVQRILRYPLLLKEILKHTPTNWPHHDELEMALAAMHEMMSDVNETQRRAENQFVSKELQDRVKDWKGLDVGSMGELLLSGVFPVTSMGEAEQEYSLFLFERVLLCCRDRITSKKTPLTKIRPSANTASSSSSRNSQTKSTSLELKGRIYLGYVTSITTTKLPTSGYLLRLGWGFASDASEHGGFDVRLANEELAQMWESTIQRLANANRVNSTRSSRSNSTTSISMNARSSQTSLNQFGRWITTNVGSIDEDYTSGSTSATTASNASYSRRPSSFRNSSGGAIHFWDESTTPGSSMDALRKLSVSSTSSQLSGTGSGNSATSRTSLPSSHYPPAQQQITSPLVGNGMQGTATAGSTASSASGFRNQRPNLVSVDSSTSLAVPGQRKVRVHIQGDTFLILVSSDLRFEQLAARVERKLKLCGKLPANGPSNSLTFEYLDEDEDRVRLESDEDLAVAFEAVPVHNELSIYVNN